MKVRIEPGTAHGTVRVPPSKSLLHRMLICAALAGGESVLCNFSGGEDLAATADCLRAMGAKLWQEEDGFHVCGFAGATAEKRGTLPALPCRESGSTLRFLFPVSLLSGGGIFTGSPRLLERGVGIYESLLASCGITFSRDAHAVTVQGKLTPGNYPIPGNLSSQFISGMLLALPALPGDSTVTVSEPFESRAYTALTTDVLKTFGVTVEHPDELRFRIPGWQHFRPADVCAEGDWSQAAFFLALNTFGGNVAVTGLCESSLQGDRVCRTLLEKIAHGATEADLSDCPDLAPMLFAAAAAHAGARFTGTRRLAVKESDRAKVMAEELEKFGISVSVAENSVEILPGRLHRPKTDLNGHGDHRIVMALSVLATITGGTVAGAEAVRKSYPDFFRDLSALGIRIRTSPEG